MPDSQTLRKALSPNKNLRNPRGSEVGLLKDHLRGSEAATDSSPALQNLHRGAQQFPRMKLWGSVVLDGGGGVRGAGGQGVGLWSLVWGFGGLEAHLPALTVLPHRFPDFAPMCCDAT